MFKILLAFRQVKLALFAA